MKVRTRKLTALFCVTICVDLPAVRSCSGIVYGQCRATDGPIVSKMDTEVAVKTSNSPTQNKVNPLNAELNPIRPLLALVGDRHIVNVSRIGVNVKTNLM